MRRLTLGLVAQIGDGAGTREVFRATLNQFEIFEWPNVAGHGLDPGPTLTARGPPCCSSLQEGERGRARAEPQADSSAWQPSVPSQWVSIGPGQRLGV